MEETLPLIQFTRTRTSAPPGSMHVLVVLLLFFCLQLQLGHRPTHARPASVWEIRVSSSAEATGRQLDLELVAAFT